MPQPSPAQQAIIREAAERRKPPADFIKDRTSRRQAMDERRAARRLVREQVHSRLFELLEALETGEDSDPIEVLQRCVTRADRFTEALEVLSDRLAPGGSMYPRTPEEEFILGLWGQDHLGDDAPSVVVTLLGEWTDRTVRLAKTAIECGIAERRQKLDERRAELVVDAFRLLVSRLNLTPEQQALVPAASREALTLVAESREVQEDE